MALSKTGRFLSKAEILGVGVFSPLSKRGGGNAILWTKRFYGHLGVPDLSWKSSTPHNHPATCLICFPYDDGRVGRAEKSAPSHARCMYDEDIESQRAPNPSRFAQPLI